MLIVLAARQAVWFPPTSTGYCPGAQAPSWCWGSLWLRIQQSVRYSVRLVPAFCRSRHHAAACFLIRSPFCGLRRLSSLCGSLGLRRVCAFLLEGLSMLSDQRILLQNPYFGEATRVVVVPGGSDGYLVFLQVGVLDFHIGEAHLFCSFEDVSGQDHAEVGVSDDYFEYSHITFLRRRDVGCVW